MELKIIKFSDIRNTNDIDSSLLINNDLIIELESCPICGSRVILNKGPNNWYAECFNCTTTGPKHWNWVNAAKMWNSRDPKVIQDLKLR